MTLSDEVRTRNSSSLDGSFTYVSSHVNVGDLGDDAVAVAVGYCCGGTTM